jgi:hypothetical protein
MKTLEQIKQLNEILKTAETATSDNTGFFIEEGVIEINGILSGKEIAEAFQRYLQANKEDILAKFTGSIRKELTDAKKEYRDHLEKEKELLKGIV